MVYPVKSGTAGSASMKFSAMLESVRKDIEGVFGILKIRFAFLKIFTNLRTHRQIDCAFVSCCILHNILLEENGYLDVALPDYPGGLASVLKAKFRVKQRESLWSCGFDNTPDPHQEVCFVDSKIVY